MAWNESGNGKDPWKRDNEEPADLDQIVRNWQRRLAGIFGGVGGSGGGTGAGGGYFLVILLVIAWGVTGFYRVDEAERGVEQRFGAYTVTTVPGLHGIFRTRLRPWTWLTPTLYRIMHTALRC